VFYLKVSTYHWVSVGLQQVLVMEVSPPEAEEFLPSLFNDQAQLTLDCRSEMRRRRYASSESMPVKVVSLWVKQFCQKRFSRVTVQR